MFVRHNQENKGERWTDIGKKKHPSSLLAWFFEGLHGNNSSLHLKTKRLYLHYIVYYFREKNVGDPNKTYKNKSRTAAL